MADIAHTLPAIVTANDGSTFGFDRPGLQISQFDAGPTRSRDWLGYNLRTYDLDPSLWQSGTTALQEWSAFWHHIGGGSEAGYIVEPVSETHRDLVCGGIADGTQTTFPIPVVAPTAVTMFVDGAPYFSGSYAVHSSSNLLTDARASCLYSAGWLDTNCTAATATGVSLDGLSCIQVTPDGGGAPKVEPSTGTSGATAGESYTAVAGVLPRVTDNYRVSIFWYTAAGAYLSTTNGSYTSCAAGSWTTLSVSGTAPATAEKLSIGVYREDLGVEFFFVDCLALIPGDYTRWHLPSQSPGLIEFATAPAAGARITATATGKRVSRCRFEPGSSWRVTGAGHAASRSIRAVEDIEV